MAAGSTGETPGSGGTVALEPVKQWLGLLSRAVRATRFYPESNATRTEQLRMAAESARQLLDTLNRLTLRVRQDALLVEKEVVLEDPDLSLGIPSVLYRHSIFGLTFLAGLDTDELKRFMAALVEDYSRSESGDDLITTLWRLELSHIQYTHVDVLAAAFRAEESESAGPEDTEMRRLKKDLVELVGELSIDHAGNDFRRAWDGYLESEVGSKQASEAEKRMIDTARTAARSRGSASFDAFSSSVQGANRQDSLTSKLLDSFLEALTEAQAGAELEPAMAVLSRMVESLLRGGDFESSLRLVERLSRVSGDDPSRRAFTQKLLGYLADEAQVTAAIERLAQGKPEERDKILSFLRLLGSQATASLYAAAAATEDGDLLASLAKLIVESAPAGTAPFIAGLRTARTELLQQFIDRQEGLPVEVRGELIWRAYDRETPQLREAAVALLVPEIGGMADALVIRAVADQDRGVRLAALKLVGTRKSPDALPALSRLLRLRKDDERDPQELEAALKAYARIGGKKVLSDLGRMLHQQDQSLSSKLLHMKQNVTNQVYVAQAISEIDDEEARAMLEKEMKSLNPVLRKACKEALESMARRRPSAVELLQAQARKGLPKPQGWALPAPPEDLKIARELSRLTPGGAQNRSVSALPAVAKKGMTVFDASQGDASEEELGVGSEAAKLPPPAALFRRRHSAVSGLPHSSAAEASAKTATASTGPQRDLHAAPSSAPPPSGPRAPNSPRQSAQPPPAAFPQAPPAMFAPPQQPQYAPPQQPQYAPPQQPQYASPQPLQCAPPQQPQYAPPQQPQYAPPATVESPVWSPRRAPEKLAAEPVPSGERLWVPVPRADPRPPPAEEEPPPLLPLDSLQLIEEPPAPPPRPASSASADADVFRRASDLFRKQDGSPRGPSKK